MKKDFSPVRFIDALAEITSHDDHQVIERSSLETLTEFYGSREYWFYQILTESPELSLGLLAYSSRKSIVTTDHPVKRELSDKPSLAT